MVVVNGSRSNERLFIIGNVNLPGKGVASMGKKILVVEDHEDSRAMMSLMIESYGYEVIEARDGLEALELVKSGCPELVSMDINMPKLDGLTAATMIKSFAHCANLPIIAVTAFTDFRERGLRAALSPYSKSRSNFRC